MSCLLGKSLRSVPSRYILNPSSLFRRGVQRSCINNGRGGIPPPLQGIKILDLTRVLAGPMATMLLGDLGADIIKVEQVGKGDDTRSWLPPAANLKPNADQPPDSVNLPPESAYFLACNRNKRSITVDFKSSDGVRLLRKLIKQSDILFENFIPEKLKGIGLGWEDCQKLNPRLIYISITGYGQTGPYRLAPGYDVIIEGEAGLMHITGENDRPPSKVGVAVTDISTGLYAHGAAMAALLSRQQTGKGVWIDCNLFDSQIAGLANIASNYLVAGVEASRHGTAHPSIVPYQAFRCKDGFIMIGAGNEKQFNALSRVLKHPELSSDPRFMSNELRVKHRDALIEIISGILMKLNKNDWLVQFHGQGIPHGPINNISETFNHPQATSRGITIEIEHPRAGNINIVAPAVMYDGNRMPIRRPPPWLGQHTDEILEELGYDEDQRIDLRRRKVV